MGKWINRTVTAVLIPALVLTVAVILTPPQMFWVLLNVGGPKATIPLIVLAALLWYARRRIRRSEWDGPRQEDR